MARATQTESRVTMADAELRLSVETSKPRLQEDEEEEKGHADPEANGAKVPGSAQGSKPRRHGDQDAGRHPGQEGGGEEQGRAAILAVMTVGRGTALAMTWARVRRSFSPATALKVKIMARTARTVVTMNARSSRPKRTAKGLSSRRVLLNWTWTPSSLM